MEYILYAYYNIRFVQYLRILLLRYTRAKKDMYFGYNLEVLRKPTTRRLYLNVS